MKFHSCNLSLSGRSPVFHPPPNAVTSVTLATRRLCWTASADCWSDSSVVCSVTTLV